MDMVKWSGFSDDEDERICTDMMQSSSA